MIEAMGPVQVLQKMRSIVTTELEDDTIYIDEATRVGELPAS